jgi:hypothetical protein
VSSIVAEKNVHICSMCIKTNQVSKQEVGIWRVQKRYPQYGIPIWSLWPNIRFLQSIVAEENATKNILDGRKDRGKTVYPPPPPGSGGKKIVETKWWVNMINYTSWPFILINMKPLWPTTSEELHSEEKRERQTDKLYTGHTNYNSWL